MDIIFSFFKVYFLTLSTMDKNSKPWGLDGAGRLGRNILACNQQINAEQPTPEGLDITVVNDPFKTVDQIVEALNRDVVHAAVPEAMREGNDSIVMGGGNKLK